MHYQNFKRFIDCCTAMGLLFILSPLFLLLTLLLAIQNRGQIFFTQVRPGKKAQFFTIYKFKTMRDTRDANGQLLPDHKRITFLGNFMRKLSLDELPQLWNVILGEMSFVGPRPLLPEYLPLYSIEQQKRHRVTPGITGWAQVNGRNRLSWKQKFELDLYYVKHQSFGLDIKILLQTIRKLIQPKDINAGQNITMEPFNGNN